MQLDDNCKLPAAACNHVNHHHATLSFARSCILGVNAHERIKSQRIFISLLICTDSANTLNSHDQSQISDIITLYIKQNAPQLLEHMAFSMGQSLLKANKKILELVLTIKKPEAISCAKNSFVTMHLVQSKTLEDEETLVSNGCH